MLYNYCYIYDDNDMKNIYTDFYSYLILENKKQAKELVVQGKLSLADFEQLVSIDPSPTKKYVGWLAQQWINKDDNKIKGIDDLRNTIEEYHVFLTGGKAKTKDIYQFKSFADLKSEVEELNAIGTESNSELRDDYEIIRDDDKLLIAVPHSHEASRYLGITKFQFRKCKDNEGNPTGQLDSAWCTTYKAPDHWNDYYFSQGATLYYVRVKDQGTIDDLEAAFPERESAMVVVALLVDKLGNLFDGYDGTDERLNRTEIAEYRKIVQI